MSQFGASMGIIKELALNCLIVLSNPNPNPNPSPNPNPNSNWRAMRYGPFR